MRLQNEYYAIEYYVQLVEDLDSLNGFMVSQAFLSNRYKRGN